MSRPTYQCRNGDRARIDGRITTGLMHGVRISPDGAWHQMIWNLDGQHKGDGDPYDIIDYPSSSAQRRT